MLNRFIVIGFAIGVVLGFGAAVLLFSRKHYVKSSANWHWADSLDAVAAAPNSHRVLYENDSIRLLEVVLQPFMQEPMHVHRWPSVMFGNNNGDTSSFDIIYYRYGYDSLRHQYFVRDSVRQHSEGGQGDTADKGNTMGPEGPHSIKNLSNVKIDIYRIEFKKPAN